MKNVDKLLHELAGATQPEEIPNIDVRGSVLKTLATQTQSTRIDVTQLVITGVAMTAACVLVFSFFSEWQTMADPWTCLTSR